MLQNVFASLCISIAMNSKENHGCLVPTAATNSLCSPTIADLFMHQTAQCCCTGLIGPVSSCGVQVLPKKFWHFPRLGKHNAKTGRAEEAMTH